MKKKKLKENICVYETLRNEIISIQEIQENLYIAMYASYLTLLVLAIQFSHYILICTFVVIIPFQARIIKYKWLIAVVSKYITTFFELEGNDIHWESFVNSKEYLVQYKMHKRNLAHVFGGTGSLQLGILSTSVFSIYIFYYKLENGWIDIILICFSFIGTILIAILDRNNSSKFKSSMMKAVDDFKMHIKEQNNR